MTGASKLDHQLDSKKKSQLILLICILLIFTVMNGTMFNVAVPDIAEEFGLMPSQVSWVMTGYILVFAVCSLMYGKLADIYPIKTLISVGVILFAVGATLGLIAPNYTTLIVARIIQAVGGATIPAFAFIIPARFLPDEKGKVFGIISSTVAFASGVGPIAGGLIGGVLEWRFLFVFSMFSILAVPLLRRWLPEEGKREGTVDFIGALFLTGFVSGFLMFVTTFNVWVLTIGFFSFILFVWRTLSVREPFIQPTMLKDRRYTTTVLTSFLGTSALFGMIFVIPIMLRDLYDMSTLGIGFVLFPGAIFAGFIGQFGGKLIELRGSQGVVVIALTLVGAGVLLISTFAGYSPWVIAICLLVTYLGFPLIQSSTANLLTTILPNERTGVGMGLFNLLNFMAGAVSSALFGSYLDLGNVSYLMNPLALSGDNMIYSNLFFILMLVTVVALSLFTWVFRGDENKKEEKQQHLASET
ncbi:MFS transporter [Texcoconibacillus texcoconensis]|uniref:DHA2 family metal-tetracycline-proton antiporter-like MFS transporter n=1 Tax=Texcoconibacillus texcoconensis TaxID=1095777 RepID=A0A840QMH0_9BACI|nr:MFS transporter [Texcoconibacillus texcoconensis]MBB5172530.1 DHA2 family metal-tetracycline-proton antiporter-like MFS transporter [Texcoconibacillus texcoconensis]